jgi:hypothetical protein
MSACCTWTIVERDVRVTNLGDADVRLESRGMDLLDDDATRVQGGVDTRCRTVSILQPEVVYLRTARQLS